LSLVSLKVFHEDEDLYKRLETDKPNQFQTPTEGFKETKTMSTTRHSHLIANPLKMMEFVTGGNAIVTFKNRDTGNRATYKVIAIDPVLTGRTDLFEVWTFTGSNNQRKTDYTLLGVVTGTGDFRYRTAIDDLNDLEAKMAKGLKGHWVDGNPGFLKSVRSALEKGYTLSNAQEFRLLGAVNKYGVDTGWYKVTDPIRVRVFPWLWDIFRFGRDVPPSIETWHEGGCCQCSHKLTVPASIEMGMGPDCAAQSGRMEEWEALDKLLGRDLDKFLQQTGRVEKLQATA